MPDLKASSLSNTWVNLMKIYEWYLNQLIRQKPEKLTLAGKLRYKTANYGFDIVLRPKVLQKGIFIVPLKEAPPAVHGWHICKLIGLSPKKLVFFFNKVKI